MTEKTETTTAAVPSIGNTIAEPDFIATLCTLQGGILPRILDQSMADTAVRVATVGDAKSKGKITLDFTFQQAKGQDALALSYSIKTSSPTAYGERTEIHKDNTTVFVNRKGAVSNAPERQGTLFDDKR